jgi:O-methyltransferase involved in polyketide biosynthesis
VTQEKVDLTGPAETMLATLYLRAVDYDLPESVLNDRWAADAVSRLDYDFDRFSRMKANSASVTLRARALDEWVRELIQPDCLVLHLGCGLDSRFERIEPPESVQWYDIDQPEVIALHRKLFPEHAQRRTIAASVTAPDLLETIPVDRPVLMIAEGLTMYLREVDGIALLRRIVDHFPSGDLLFDAFSRLGVRLSNRFNPPVVISGSQLEWGIDDPQKLAARVPGLSLISEQSFDADLRRIPPPMRLTIQLISRLPVTRRLSRLLHYRF